MTKKQLKNRKITGAIFGVFFAVLIFFALLLIYTLIPIEGNYKMYAVTSGSMGHAVPEGSIIVVRPQIQYQVGDIITFHTVSSHSRDPITHRIVKVDEQNSRYFYTTKGDANEDADAEKVIIDNIRGKYIFYFPLIGYIVGFAKTLPGLIILIIIPATIIIYEELKKIKIELLRLKKNKTKKRHAKN